MADDKKINKDIKPLTPPPQTQKTEQPKNVLPKIEQPRQVLSNSLGNKKKTDKKPK